jgi:dihydroorotase
MKYNSLPSNLDFTKFLKLFIGFSFLLINSSSFAQTYDLLIKNGRIIDPKNNLDQQLDIAIKGGKIVKISATIDATAAQIVNAEGKIVVPGLIDMHAHVFFGTESDHYLSNGLSAVMPDGFTFRTGVTTVVDAGGAGWKSFATFKKNIIDNSQTRVLSFLNIVGEGMVGGIHEQNLGDMDSRMTALVAKSNKNWVVGLKVAHYNGPEWTPIDEAVKAGSQANIPVMIDFGGNNPPNSIEELFFNHLRPGDIYTHTYTDLRPSETGPFTSRESILNVDTQKMKPFVFDAQKRGIIFDVGYGGASFNYSQAIPALQQGFFPNTISTDLHTGSMNTSMKDQLSVMSKFMQMGMPIMAVIKASTWSPAQVIKREELGHISVDAIADIAILNIREGNFGFYDKTGFKVNANQKFECEMTIKDGLIKYDLNGIANPIYQK